MQRATARAERAGRLGGGVAVEVPVAWTEAPAIVRVRAHVVIATIALVREHGHFDAYRKTLAQHGALRLLEIPAGDWVSASDMLHHVAALDAIELMARDAEAIGAELGERSFNTLLATLMRLAAHLGATPWTALRQAPKIWTRTYDGGVVSLFREDEQTARLEFWRNPMSSSETYRHMNAGACLYGVRLFAHGTVRSQVLGPADGGQSFGVRFWLPASK